MLLTTTLCSLSSSNNVKIECNACYLFFYFLKFVDIILTISHPVLDILCLVSSGSKIDILTWYLLFQNASQRPLTLIRGLLSSDGCEHSIWSTHKDYRTRRSGLGKVFFHQLLGDKALVSVPLFWWSIQSIHKLESIRIGLCIRLQLIPEKNIIFSLVGKYQSNIGVLVGGILAENLTDELKLTCNKQI